jgi:hypothetical protein
MRGLAWVLGITRDPDLSAVLQRVYLDRSYIWRCSESLASICAGGSVEPKAALLPLYLHYSTTAMRSKGAPGAGSTPQKSEAANRSPTPGRTSGMQAPGGSWRVLHGHVQFSGMYVTCFGPSECRRWLQKQNYPLFSVFVGPWWPRARGSQCVACLWLLLVAGG